MSLKIGDKVKMTKEGFDYYSDLYNAFDSYGVLSCNGFEECVCTLFSIHGIGTIKQINNTKDYKVRWKFTINGQYYYSTMWYEAECVRKLTLKEKLLSFFGVN